MNCNVRFENILSLENDKELEAHIRNCPICAERLIKLQAMEERIKESLAQPESVPDISDSVMSHIEGMHRQPTQRIRFAYAIGLLAAACLAVFILARVSVREPAIVATVPNRVSVNTHRAPLEHKPQRVENNRQINRIHHRIAHKKAIHTGYDKTIERQAHPVMAHENIDLHMELRFNENTEKIVVAVGNAKRVIKTKVKNESALPLDANASSINRPPLVTVVSVNHTASIMHEM